MAAGVLVVLFAGQSVGEFLVSLTGGVNNPAPYTSLAYLEPESAAGGLVRGDSVEFVITNVTGEKRDYHWSATIGGRKVADGTAVSDAVNTRRVVTVELARAGALTFAVDGLPQTLTGVVAPGPDASRKKAR